MKYICKSTGVEVTFAKDKDGHDGKPNNKSMFVAANQVGKAKAEPKAEKKAAPKAEKKAEPEAK